MQTNMEGNPLIIQITLLGLLFKRSSSVSSQLVHTGRHDFRITPEKSELKVSEFEIVLTYKTNFREV